MAFPSTNDYKFLPFCAPVSNHTYDIALLDTGGHAKVVDIIVDVTTVQTSWAMPYIMQHDTNAMTGAYQMTTACGIPAAIATWQTATGQWKFRLKAGEAAGMWDGPIDGRYITPVLTGTGNYNVSVTALVHNSDEYPVE